MVVARAVVRDLYDRQESARIFSILLMVMGIAPIVAPLAGGFGQAGMFAYISGSPFVFIDLYGVPAHYYGWLFGLNATGIVAFTQINRRLLLRYDADCVLDFGNLAGFTTARRCRWQRWSRPAACWRWLPIAAWPARNHSNTEKIIPGDEAHGSRLFAFLSAGRQNDARSSARTDCNFVSICPGFHELDR